MPPCISGIGAYVHLGMDTAEKINVFTFCCAVGFGEFAKTVMAVLFCCCEGNTDSVSEEPV